MNDTTGAPNIIISDCLKTVGLDGRLLAMDPDGLCLMEIDDFSDVEGKPWAALWPVESQFLVTAAVEQAVAGRVARFSADCPTAKGTPKRWEVSVAPIRNIEGEIVALQSLSQDVTRREHDTRERVLVSRELAHRIKNLFAVVDRLVHLSSRTQPEARTFVEGFRQRLGGLGRAIAFIHPIDVAEVGEAPRTVKGLIAALAAPYGQSGASIVVEGDDADIAQDAVTSVAMVLNELATNAVKYGALKDAGGRLSIRLIRGPETVVIHWNEDVERAADRPVTPGFGTSLLDRTVRHQLSGTLTRDWTATGLQVRLELPLAVLGAEAR